MILCAARLCAETSESPSQPDCDLPCSLIERARDKSLHRDPQWLRLLHFRPSPFGGSASEILPGAFFLSPKGAKDSEAELEATIRAFFRGPITDTIKNDSIIKSDGDSASALCRFPARLKFLQARLEWPEGAGNTMENSPCEAYRRYISALDARNVSLIYASSHIGHPASLFGHTFLRISSSGNTPDLLDHSLVYGTEESLGDGLLMPFKGLLGLYPGSYDFFPFYASLQKYGVAEDRDVWEYRLALKREELNRLIDHAWELRQARKPYYFMTGNCSHNILTLIEAAVPGANLVSEKRVAALPATTVQSLVNAGLAEKGILRPSMLNSVLTRVATLTNDEKEILAGLLRGGSLSGYMRQTDGWDQKRLTFVLDIALDLIQYRKRESGGRRAGNRARIAGIQKALLLERSRMPASVIPAWADSAPPMPDKQPSAPEESHAPHLAGFTGGISGTSRFFQIGFRYTHHDLNASLSGFSRGIVVENLQMKVRFYGNNGAFRGAPVWERVTMQSFQLLKLQSLAPISRFNSPLSWHMELKWEAQENQGCISCGALIAEGGPGLAVDIPFPLPALAFAFAQARLEAFPWSRVYPDVGPAFSVGARISSRRDEISLLGQTDCFLPALSNNGQEWSPNWKTSSKIIWKSFLELRVSWTRNTEVRLALNRSDRGLYSPHTEATMTWNLYF